MRDMVFFALDIGICHTFCKWQNVVMTDTISNFNQNLNQQIKVLGFIQNYTRVFWSTVGINLCRKVDLQKYVCVLLL